MDGRTIRYARRSRNTGLPIRHLKLRDCHIADDLCHDLADLPVLDGLKSLEISGGISPHGARALARRADAFRAA